MSEFTDPARLDLEEVTISYNGKAAVDNLSLQIAHGDQVAIVGPNGAGKSTLFKALVGLLPVQRGRIFIHGQPLGHHQDCVAYIPQREEVDWRFPVTVLDVVMMGRYGKFGWLRRPGKKDYKIALRSMEQMGIVELRSRSIGELSGGQQQRVFLARALAQEPHILLMDEPFTGVDASTQETTLRLLRDLKTEGVTVLVSTHDLNMAAGEFNQVALLNHRLVAYGKPAQVFTSEHLASAFGGQLLNINGTVVVDQCCSGDEEGHTH